MKFTRRHCVLIVSEIFDLIKLITPFTSGIKIDLHPLVQKKLNWDNTIPDATIIAIWETHFQKIQETKNTKNNQSNHTQICNQCKHQYCWQWSWKQKNVCVVIYASCEIPNGEFYFQLIILTIQASTRLNVSTTSWVICTCP